MDTSEEQSLEGVASAPSSITEPGILSRSSIGTSPPSLTLPCLSTVQAAHLQIVSSSSHENIVPPSPKRVVLRKRASGKFPSHFFFEKVIGNYRIIKKIGKGRYGLVKLGEHVSTGSQVAIKIVDKTGLNVVESNSIKTEAEVMTCLNHPNVVRLYEVIETNHELALIMEYAAGGDLFEYVLQKRKLKEKEARRLFVQIVAGLAYCHRRFVVHRDIKAENILLDENNNVRIGDWGFSSLFHPGLTIETACGSLDYAAPEVLTGLVSFGPSVDIWSLGVLLYFMVSGRLPFTAPNDFDIYQLIKSGDYQSPRGVSKECKNLLKSLLNPDPRSRVNISEVEKHPWLSMKEELLVPSSPTVAINPTNNTKFNSKISIHESSDIHQGGDNPSLIFNSSSLQEESFLHSKLAKNAFIVGSSASQKSSSNQTRTQSSNTSSSSSSTSPKSKRSSSVSSKHDKHSKHENLDDQKDHHRPYQPGLPPISSSSPSNSSLTFLNSQQQPTSLITSKKKSTKKEKRSISDTKIEQSIHKLKAGSGHSHLKQSSNSRRPPPLKRTPAEKALASISAKPIEAINTITEDEEELSTEEIGSPHSNDARLSYYHMNTNYDSPCYDSPVDSGREDSPSLKHLQDHNLDDLIDSTTSLTITMPPNMPSDLNSASHLSNASSESPGRKLRSNRTFNAQKTKEELAVSKFIILKLNNEQLEELGKMPQFDILQVTSTTTNRDEQLNSVVVSTKSTGARKLLRQFEQKRLFRWNSDTSFALRARARQRADATPPTTPSRNRTPLSSTATSSTSLTGRRRSSRGSGSPPRLSSANVSPFSTCDFDAQGTCNPVPVTSGLSPSITRRKEKRSSTEQKPTPQQIQQQSSYPIIATSGSNILLSQKSVSNGQSNNVSSSNGQSSPHQVASPHPTTSPHPLLKSNSVGVPSSNNSSTPPITSIESQPPPKLGKIHKMNSWSQSEFDNAGPGGLKKQMTSSSKDSSSFFKFFRKKKSDKFSASVVPSSSPPPVSTIAVASDDSTLAKSVYQAEIEIPKLSKIASPASSPAMIRSPKSKRKDKKSLAKPENDEDVLTSSSTAQLSTETHQTSTNASSTSMPSSNGIMSFSTSSYSPPPIRGLKNQEDDYYNAGSSESPETMRRNEATDESFTE